MLVTSARTDIIKDQSESVTGYSLTNDLGMSRIFFMNYDVLDRAESVIDDLHVPQLSCPCTLEKGETLVYMGDNYVFVPKYHVVCRMNLNDECYPRVTRA